MNHDTEANSVYRKERDAKHNASSSPPEGEEVRIPAIWVIEAFTPRLIGNLYSGADKLGWSSADFSINSNFPDSITNWRESAGGGGWLNLGFIVPSAQKRGPFHHRQAPLPQGVEAIRATISQPFASTTLLCFQFIFEDENATSLEKPLRETFATYSEPVRDSVIRFISVEQQKEQAVEVMRGYLRTLCTDWVRQHFAGFFCTNATSNSIPACELMLFTKHDDFSDLRASVEPSMVQMLGLCWSSDTWQSDDLPAMYLQFQERREPHLRRAVLFGNVDKALAGKDLQAYGEGKSEQIVHWLQDFDQTLGTWALELIATSLVAEMGKTRDLYGSLEFSAALEDPQVLRSLDTRLLDFQRDALPFAFDLGRYCDGPNRFMHNVFEFEPTRKMKDFELKLFRDMRSRLGLFASHIKQTERQIRSIAAQTGRIITAASNERLSRSNLSLQRGIYWMTITMLLLTAAMAVDPLEKLWKYLLTLNQ